MPPKKKTTEPEAEQLTFFNEAEAKPIHVTDVTTPIQAAEGKVALAIQSERTGRGTVWVQLWHHKDRLIIDFSHVADEKMEIVVNPARNVQGVFLPNAKSFGNGYCVVLAFGEEPSDVRQD